MPASDTSSNKAPHVAVFTPHLGSGGAERMSLFVTKALADAGMRVDLIVSHPEGVLLDHPVVRAHGVDLGGKNEWAVAPLLRYYRRERPSSFSRWAAPPSSSRASPASASRRCPS